MAASRKLQGEIQQVLKKVEEGVSIFDETWDKVYAAGQQSLKEKYEGDLKKEIKKLQRLRDQIKTWIANNDIKDKSQLVDARKIIESKMEQFKVCEKDTKTKAYSKEGLAREAKLDPKEAMREEKRGWVKECIEQLHDLENAVEADKEKLMSAKGSKSKNRDLMEKCDNKIQKHKWHIARLELIIKLLDNEELDPAQLDDITDSLEYYIESAADDDGALGVEHEFDIYEDLGLDELNPTAFELSPRGGDDGADKTESKADAAVESTEAKKVSASSVINALNTNTVSKARPAPTAAKTTTTAKPAAKTPATTSKTPATTAKTEKKTPVSFTQAAAAGTTASTTNTTPTTQSTTTPVPPATTASVVAKHPDNAAAPEKKSTPAAELPATSTTSQPTTSTPLAPTTASPNKVPAAVVPASTSVVGSAVGPEGNTPGTSAVVGAKVEQVSASSTAMSPKPTSVVAPSEVPKSPLPSGALSGSPHVSGQQGVLGIGTQSPAPSQTLSGANSPLPSQPMTSPSRLPAATNPFGIGGLLPSMGAIGQPAGGFAGPPSFPSMSSHGLPTAPQQKLTPDQLVSLNMLKHSMMNSPESLETEKPNNSFGYTPRNLYTHSHPAFPSTPLFTTSSENNALFERLPMDALFFVFYFQQGTYQQFLAAKQLKKHSWRFHRKYMTWFQRHEEPKIATDDFEEGTYVYFDYESGWCQRIKSEFKFEYAYLEDELNSPSTNNES